MNMLTENGSHHRPKLGPISTSFGDIDHLLVRLVTFWANSAYFRRSRPNWGRFRPIACDFDQSIACDFGQCFGDFDNVCARSTKLGAILTLVIQFLQMCIHFLRATCRTRNYIGQDLLRRVACTTLTGSFFRRRRPNARKRHSDLAGDLPPT